MLDPDELVCDLWRLCYFLHLCREVISSYVHVEFCYFDGWKVWIFVGQPDFVISLWVWLVEGTQQKIGGRLTKMGTFGEFYSGSLRFFQPQLGFEVLLCLVHWVELGFLDAKTLLKRILRVCGILAAENWVLGLSVTCLCKRISTLNLEVCKTTRVQGALTWSCRRLVKVGHGPELYSVQLHWLSSRPPALTLSYTVELPLY